MTGGTEVLLCVIKAPWNLTPESIAEAADATPFAYEW